MRVLLGKTKAEPPEDRCQNKRKEDDEEGKERCGDAAVYCANCNSRLRRHNRLDAKIAERETNNERGSEKFGIPQPKHFMFEAGTCVRCFMEDGVDEGQEERGCSIVIPEEFFMTCTRGALKNFAAEWAGLEPRAKTMTALRQMLRMKWWETGLIDVDPRPGK